MIVTTGLIGRGKLISSNSSFCPHDAISGKAIADGTDACDTLQEMSYSSSGHAFQKGTSPSGSTVSNSKPGGEQTIDVDTKKVVVTVQVVEPTDVKFEGHDSFTVQGGLNALGGQKQCSLTVCVTVKVLCTHSPDDSPLVSDHKIDAISCCVSKVEIGDVIATTAVQCTLMASYVNQTSASDEGCSAGWGIYVQSTVLRFEHQETVWSQSSQKESDSKDSNIGKEEKQYVEIWMLDDGMC